MIALFAISATTLADADPHAKVSKYPAACNNVPVTASEFRPFSQKVWNQDHWQRGMPAKGTLAAEKKKLMCAASPSHRKSMKNEWSKDKATYFDARSDGLWRKKYRSYEYPDGSHWAAPYPIAWCESGGDYYASSAGAYGEIPPYPQNQPPKVQDEIAYQLMHEGKEYSAWVEWEKGCIYR